MGIIFYEESKYELTDTTPIRGDTVVALDTSQYTEEEANPRGIIGWVQLVENYSHGLTVDVRWSNDESNSYYTVGKDVAVCKIKAPVKLHLTGKKFKIY